MDLWSVCSNELNNAHFAMTINVSSNPENDGQLVMLKAMSRSYSNSSTPVFLALPLQHSVQKFSFLHSNKLTSTKAYMGIPGPALTIAGRDLLNL